MDKRIEYRGYKVVADIIRYADFSTSQGCSPLKNRWLWLLNNGQLFRWQPLPALYPRGPLGQCYNNAHQLVRKYPKDLYYTEGYGLVGGVTPLAHAWAVDAQGNVVDPTWEDGTDYFGVVFSFDYLKRVTYSGRRCTALIDNWRDRWPLIDGRHTDWMPRSYKAPVSNEKWL